jgi:hypothetical protein
MAGQSQKHYKNKNIGVTDEEEKERKMSAMRRSLRVASYPNVFSHLPVPEALHSVHAP